MTGYGALCRKTFRCTDYSGCIISAGFIETHVHYVQTGIIAAPGKQLLQWVSDYVYPVEEAFADEAHARAVASVFCDTLLRNGTTTACVYCAVYPQSVDPLFAAAAQRRMRMIAGKYMMDRNVPQTLRDTAKTGYDKSKALIGNGTGKNGSPMPSRRAGPDRARRPSSRRQVPCGASTPSCTDRPTSPRADDAGRRPRRACNLRGGAARAPAPAG